MTRTTDSGDDEPEYHPEADDAGVFWCPKCGSEMYGDSTRCPKCGDYVTPGARPSGSSMPRWMWAALILAGLGLLAGLIASLR
jgi:hypothetical protein